MLLGAIGLVAVTGWQWLSLILASLLAGRLIDPVSRDPGLIIGVVMALLAVSVTVTLLGTPETPTDGAPAPKAGSFFSQFRVDLRENQARPADGFTLESRTKPGPD